MGGSGAVMTLVVALGKVRVMVMFGTGPVAFGGGMTMLTPTVLDAARVVAAG